MVVSTYKDYIPTVDIKRDVEKVSYDTFEGAGSPLVKEFLSDMETSNDPIELHLIRTKAYKELLILPLNHCPDSRLRSQMLEDEQKTFSGSKIFYRNDTCSKLLILAIKGELMNKLNMVATRINKVNQRIRHHNAQIKKDNESVYQERSAQLAAKKDDIIHYLNENLTS